MSLLGALSSTPEGFATTPASTSVPVASPLSMPVAETAAKVTQTGIEAARVAQGGAETVTAKCSRAGCTEAAMWRLDWWNPRIHRDVSGKAKTTKTWLACEEHLVFLRDFLASRDFPLTVERFEVPA